MSVADDIVRIGEIHDLVMAGKLSREALDYAWARLWAQRTADAWKEEQKEKSNDDL